MAWVSTSDKYRKQDLTSGGDSAGMTTSGQGQAQPQQPGQPQGASSWVNLQDYLKLNQGSAGDMGTKLADNVEKGATDAETGRTDLIGQFKKDVDAGTPGYNGTDITTPDQAGTAASGIQYTGPTAVADEAGYDDVTTQSHNATQKIKDAETDSGRSSWLRDTYGKGTNYTQGENALDSFLTGAGSGARVQDIDSEDKNLNQAWDNFNGGGGDVAFQDGDTMSKQETAKGIVGNAALKTNAARSAYQDLQRKLQADIDAKEAAKAAARQQILDNDQASKDSAAEYDRTHRGEHTTPLSMEEFAWLHGYPTLDAYIAAGKPGWNG